MAAATVNLRAYLRNVIGLGMDAEGLERANAIIDEGVNSAENLVDMYDGDGIKTLCSNVRKPGGTIEDPTYVGPGPAPRIPRPGRSIPTVCEKRLTQAAYGAKLYASIERNVDTANLNRARLRQFKLHLDMVTNHEEPDSLPSISKAFTVVKFLDQLPTYLRELHGVSQVSLSYLIREDATPPNPLPPLLPNVPWSNDRNSIMDELIQFTPHDGPNYEADNARLFGILSKELSGTSSMASITRFQRRRDGRGAYMALVTHNLGTNKWEKMVEQAESTLSTRIWNGKNARYPLRVHIARHREAYNDLERASHHIAYNPPNETSRVRYLLTSIQSSDATICSAKTTVLADTNKKNDFESAADFILETAPSDKNTRSIHRISATRSQPNKNRNTGRGKIKIGPKPGWS